MQTILVTGAYGYLGSHMVVGLMQKGYTVIAVDTCERSSTETGNRIALITGSEPIFCQIDYADTDSMIHCMNTHKVDAVIHFAGYKAVGESCEKPLLYYKNNLGGTIALLESMKAVGVKNLLFSSSATVYDAKGKAPFTENSTLGKTTNPYGTTKYLIELMLDDYVAHTDSNIISLRYFNPVGAHKSTIIGEDITYSNLSLISFVMKTLIGEREQLHVYGGDRPTSDGSCIRDFISVNDLVEGHIAALEYMDNNHCLNEKFNLGTGKGVSVLEFIGLVEKATGKELPYTIVSRREGDNGEVYSDASKAKKMLGRECKESLVDAIRFEREFIRNIT